MASGVNVAELTHLNPLEHLPDDHFLAIIYGVRRSGKTTILRQLVYDLYPRVRDYHVYVLCSTARFNTTSYDWVPKKAIYSDVTDIEKVVGELLASQKEKLEKLAKSGKLKPAGVSGQGGAKKKGKGPAQGKRSNPNHAHEKEKRQKLTEAAQYALANSKDATGGDGDDEDDVPDILVIMDDVCSEESIRHSRAMGTVSMNGRQYRMSVLILSQMVAGSGSIPPRVRTQVRRSPCPARAPSLRSRAACRSGSGGSTG